MKPTRVFNMHTEPGFTQDPDFVRIDRCSPFGCPFRIGEDGTREHVVEKYRQYFRSRIATDADFIEKVLRLKGKLLGCWCKPLPCHGDIIAEYLNNLEG